LHYIGSCVILGNVDHSGGSQVEPPITDTPKADNLRRADKPKSTS